MIPPALGQIPERGFRHNTLCRCLLVIVERIDVAVFFNAGKRRVRHAKLLPLIDKWRTAHEHIPNRQHLGGFHAVLAIVTKFGYGADHIMVFQKQRNPTELVCLDLPV